MKNEKILEKSREILFLYNKLSFLWPNFLKNALQGFTKFSAKCIFRHAFLEKYNTKPLFNSRLENNGSERYPILMRFATGDFSFRVFR